MKKLIISFFILFAFSGCVYGGKYMRTSGNEIFVGLLNAKIKPDVTLKIHLSKGILFDSMEGSYNVVFGNTSLASANIIQIRDFFNKASKSNKKISVAVYGDGQNLTKIILKHALQQLQGSYQNIHLIYIGEKEYSEEIKAAAEKKGINYNFLDIKEVTK